MQHKRLKAGTVLRKGDQFKGGVWTSWTDIVPWMVGTTVGHAWHIFRRPLKAAEVAKTATNKRSSKLVSIKVKRTASSKVR